MTKLSYDAKSRQFIVSELGRIVDSDPDFGAIAIRNGFVSDDEEPNTDEESADKQKEQKEQKAK